MQLLACYVHWTRTVADTLLTFILTLPQSRIHTYHTNGSEIRHINYLGTRMHQSTVHMLILHMISPMHDIHNKTCPTDTKRNQWTVQRFSILIHCF